MARYRLALHPIHIASLGAFQKIVQAQLRASQALLPRQGCHYTGLSSPVT